MSAQIDKEALLLVIFAHQVQTLRTRINHLLILSFELIIIDALFVPIANDLIAIWRNNAYFWLKVHILMNSSHTWID